MKVIDLIKDSQVIVLVNEVKFIGDSSIFFWPLVDGFISAFPDKKFIVYHSYENIFISPSSHLVCYGTEETFIKEVCLYDTNTTLVVAFISQPKGIVATLIQKEFKGLYKGFVGLDFWTFNLPVITFDNNIIVSREIQGNNDNKYHFTFDNSILSTSAKRASFPEIGIPYESVYGYAQKCNSITFGVECPIKMSPQFLNVKELSLSDINSLLVWPLEDSNKAFILINLNVGNHKEKLLQANGGVVDLIKTLFLEIKELKENYNIILTYPDFPINVYLTLEECIVRLNLKSSISVVRKELMDSWLSLIIQAHKVLSYDTGFVHLAYVLNDRVLSIGGDSDFWHYPAQDYVLMNYYDKEGNFLKHKFNESMFTIINWIKQ